MRWVLHRDKHLFHAVTPVHGAAAGEPKSTVKSVCGLCVEAGCEGVCLCVGGWFDSSAVTPTIPARLRLIRRKESARKVVGVCLF